MSEKTNITHYKLRERAEYEEASTRHAQISKLIIQQDYKTLESLYGSVVKAELELEELEHFLNYGERKGF